jgi:hypothetical protein
MPPKELLKVFEPKYEDIRFVYRQVEGDLIADLSNNTSKPADILIEITTVMGRVGEVTLTVNGKKRIINPEWEASLSTLFQASDRPSQGS